MGICDEVQFLMESSNKSMRRYGRVGSEIPLYCCLLFVVTGCICIMKLVLLSKFNVVYLHNYQVLDYGSWGLVLLHDGHLIRLQVFFLSYRNEHKNGAPKKFFADCHNKAHSFMNYFRYYFWYYK